MNLSIFKYLWVTTHVLLAMQVRAGIFEECSDIAGTYCTLDARQAGRSITIWNVRHMAPAWCSGGSYYVQFDWIDSNRITYRNHFIESFGWTAQTPASAYRYTKCYIGKGGPMSLFKYSARVQKLNNGGSYFQYPSDKRRDFIELHGKQYFRARGRSCNSGVITFPKDPIDAVPRPPKNDDTTAKEKTQPPILVIPNTDVAIIEPSDPTSNGTTNVTDAEPPAAIYKPVVPPNENTTLIPLDTTGWIELEHGEPTMPAETGGPSPRLIQEGTPWWVWLLLALGVLLALVALAWCVRRLAKGNEKAEFEAASGEEAFGGEAAAQVQDPTIFVQ